MAFNESPGVYTREIDKTIVAQSGNATSGAFAGKFSWGPVNRLTQVSGEEDLAARFGKPNDSNAVDFMTAASYLAYSNSLFVVRIGNTTDMKNASDATSNNITILNEDDYETKTSSLTSAAWIAKYPGDLGNSLSVAVCDSPENFSTELPGTFSVSRGSKDVEYTPAEAETLTDYFNVGDILAIDGFRYSVASFTETAITLSRHYAGTSDPTTFTREWRYGSLFGQAPGEDRVHVIVVDRTGLFSDDPGMVLERFDNLSTIQGAKFQDGTNAYYKTAINRGSEYIYAGGAAPQTVNEANKVDFVNLTGGSSASASLGLDEQIDGFDLFKNKTTVPAPLMFTGAASATASSFVIENVAEIRRDCMVFVSPSMQTVVNNAGREARSIIEFRQSLPDSAFFTIDSGWKLMYDRYNDTNRWVPLNGDIAGLYAQTDRTNAVWASAAGYNRGKVKNVIRLAYSPEESDRDMLYASPNNINPVIDDPGRGAILLGDKTGLGSNSAFSRVPVRRMFSAVEGRVTEASNSILFEVNDEVTRAQFVSTIEPYLKQIKGQRGIEDYRIIADQSVNTPQVVNNNQFVGQVYIKPLYSINFIRIDFVAVRSGVSFDEVVVDNAA